MTKGPEKSSDFPASSSGPCHEIKVYTVARGYAQLSSSNQGMVLPAPTHHCLASGLICSEKSLELCEIPFQKASSPLTRLSFSLHAVPGEMPFFRVHCFNTMILRLRSTRTPWECLHLCQASYTTAFAVQLVLFYFLKEHALLLNKRKASP